ncbi:efflux RND transporter periplasmic adaptor subunit, partial [Thermodesulfobacteriota bacterium]
PMTKKFKIVLAALVLVGFVAFQWLRSPHVEEGDHAGEHGHAGHDHEGHDDHDGHEGDHGASDLTKSVDEIIKINCEHGIPAYKCRECSCEVGVVKIDPSLFNDSGDSQKALMKKVKVRREKVDTLLLVTGEAQLNANAASHITPRVPGIVRSVNVDIGSEVEKDDVLFEIDSVELGYALSDYQKYRAMAELSRKNFERERSLYERKISSESDMIQAQMAYEQYKAELKAVEQKLRMFGLIDASALDTDGPDIYGVLIPVRAPFDGTIIGKHAVRGELVGPDKEVMLLADLATLWVWADIYEQDLAVLLQCKEEGDIPVEVSVRAFSGRVFAGEIDYIGATMDENTRTVKVRATVDNRERLLRPGMFCEIRILPILEGEALTIPENALFSDEGRDFVFKHLRDDRYIRRVVKRGRKFHDSVEILKGLEPGETIVADGAFLMKSDVLRGKMGAGCAD